MNNDVDWSKVYMNGNDFRTLTPYELTNILEYLPKQGDVLDIGCGTGQLTRDLWFRGFNVKGIDPSSKAIEFAKNASMRAAILELRYDTLDVFSLPKSELYDLIFCKLVYAFIEDKEVFLDNVRQHIRGDGAFIIITPVLGSKISMTKPFICVDPGLTFKQLNKMFDTVSTLSLGDVECFIARGPRALP